MIEKTRPEPPGAPDDALARERDPGPARGVLRSAVSPSGVFHHARIAPPAALAGFVQHYWIVRWDLQGQPPQRRETLPHPNVHLVIERGGTRIFGVHSARFERVLEGSGQVFGVTFRPGGFRPFVRAPIRRLTDGSMAIADAFGPEAGILEDDVLAIDDDSRQADIVTRFLGARWPLPDPIVDRVAGLVETIERDHSLTRADDLAGRGGLGLRALQRLFNDYVGVGPKWVINRYRLHEALERLAAGAPVDWARLAQDLGYCDQAHFIRDFRRLVGRTPTAYARESLAPIGSPGRTGRPTPIDRLRDRSRR